MCFAGIIVDADHGLSVPAGTGVDAERRKKQSDERLNRRARENARIISVLHRLDGGSRCRGGVIQCRARAWRGLNSYGKPEWASNNGSQTAHKPPLK